MQCHLSLWCWAGEEEGEGEHFTDADPQQAAKQLCLASVVRLWDGELSIATAHLRCVLHSLGTRRLFLAPNFTPFYTFASLHSLPPSCLYSLEKFSSLRNVL